ALFASRGRRVPIEGLRLAIIRRSANSRTWNWFGVPRTRAARMVIAFLCALMISPAFSQTEAPPLPMPRPVDRIPNGGAPAGTPSTQVPEDDPIVVIDETAAPVAAG